jgi:hypothetical protein
MHKIRQFGQQIKLEKCLTSQHFFLEFGYNMICYRLTIV